MPDSTAGLLDALVRLGGVARWGQLRRVVGARAIANGVRRQAVIRTARGRYALPGSDEARRAASRLSGVCSHLSAAAHWGWPVKLPPGRPHVTVPSNRKVSAERRAGVVLHWRTLAPADTVDGWVTTPVRTVVDCCLDLPFDEALAVFDAAWRSRLLVCRDVQLAAMRLPRRQRGRVLAVARVATPLAANPFESVLRAIALGVPGLNVAAQHPVRDRAFFARVDLADEELRIVLEADSFEFHGQRSAMAQDCRRYDELAVRGWLVLRFSWEQVMFEPEWVAGTIRAAVAFRQARLPAGRRRRPRRATGPDAAPAGQSA